MFTQRCSVCITLTTVLVFEAHRYEKGISFFSKQGQTKDFKKGRFLMGFRKKGSQQLFAHFAKNVNEIIHKIFQKGGGASYTRALPDPSLNRMVLLYFINMIEILLKQCYGALSFDVTWICHQFRQRIKVNTHEL